jgi:hypothetical protein
MLAGTAMAALFGAASAFAQYQALPLPPHAIGDMLIRQGFTAFSPPRLRGDVFILEAVTARGAQVRLTIDAYNGEIVDSVRLSPPVGAPQDIRRGVIEPIEPQWPGEEEDEIAPEVAPDLAPAPQRYRDTVLEPPVGPASPAPAPAVRPPQPGAAKAADPAAPAAKPATKAAGAAPADAKAAPEKPTAAAVKRTGPVRVIQGVTPVPAPAKPEQ